MEGYSMIGIEQYNRLFFENINANVKQDKNIMIL